MLRFGGVEYSIKGKTRFELSSSNVTFTPFLYITPTYFVLWTGNQVNVSKTQRLTVWNTSQRKPGEANSHWSFSTSPSCSVVNSLRMSGGMVSEQLVWFCDNSYAWKAPQQEDWSSLFSWTLIFFLATYRFCADGGANRLYDLFSTDEERAR